MKQVILVAVLFFSVLDISAQQRSKADVSIVSLTLVSADPPKNRQPTQTVAPGTTKNIALSSLGPKDDPQSFKCSITVQNGNQQNAYGTKLIVLIPTFCGVSVSSQNATVHKVSDYVTPVGYVEFDLGQLAPQETRTLNLSITKLPWPEIIPYRNTVSAFVFTKSEDTNPVNNSKTTTY